MKQAIALLPPHLLQEIDDWRDSLGDDTRRSQAIRRLLVLGLRSLKKSERKGAA